MQQAVILVTEGDAGVRNLQAMVLQELGATVVEAASPREAVRLAAEVQPDVVLLDLGLPREDGLAAVESLRHHPATLGCPVVVVVDAEHGLRGFDTALAVDGFLQKPFRVSELVTVIEEVLTRQGVPGAIQAV